jgi:hypothetical protein
VSLAALQSSLVAAVTSPRGPDPDMLRAVRTDDGITGGERLDAYRANVQGAHLQALDQVYPVTREVLGPRYWRQLLERELTVFASSSADLNSYGDFLPNLLGKVQHRNPELAELPYLEELATLEWAVHRARFAADDSAFDWDRFVGLAEDVRARSRLVRSNALVVQQLKYPVDEIWRAHNSTTTAVHGDTETIACCVHRDGRFGVAVSRIDIDEFTLLNAMARDNIGQLRYGGHEEEAAALASKIFEWIRRRWIVGFEPG